MDCHIDLSPLEPLLQRPGNALQASPVLGEDGRRRNGQTGDGAVPKKQIPACIRVLLVDDHALVRCGLVTFLKEFDDLELVAEAASGEEALQRCAALQPDVVLMDLVLPKMGGIEATRTIRERFPQVRVIVLTSFLEEAFVQGAFQAGASGYLLKTIMAEDLAQAIRTVHCGRPVLDPEAGRVLVQATAQPPAPGQNLTAREREVLGLMTKGLSNSEIAARLVVSPSTVKTHVSSILAKLEVTTRTEAAVLAVQSDWVPCQISGSPI